MLVAATRKLKVLPVVLVLYMLARWYIISVVVSVASSLIMLFVWEKYRGMRLHQELGLDLLLSKITSQNGNTLFSNPNPIF